MLRRLVRGAVAVAVLGTIWSVGGPAPQAAATATLCSSVVQNPVVGGIDYSRLNVTRQCLFNSDGAVAGMSYLADNRLTVTFNEQLSAQVQVQKTTLHELTHFVEWLTTDAYRKQLYAYLGVTTDGKYSSVKLGYGSNPTITEWMASDRERLAESAVACVFGSNSFAGMSLVPSWQCTSFLNTYRAAIAATTPAGSTTTTSPLTRATSAITAKATSVSWLGPATTGVTALGSGFVQYYTAGAITYTDAAGAHAVGAQTAKTFTPLSGAGQRQGFPTGDTTLARGVEVTPVAAGALVWSSQAGLIDIINGNHATYASLGGGWSALLAPTTPEIDGAVAGSRVNRMVGGTISWSASTGSHAVQGGIATYYGALGYEASYLGLPTSNEFASADGTYVSTFQGGRVVWSSPYGSHSVRNGILAEYAWLGAEAVVGAPSGDEYPSLRGIWRQDFRTGAIIWSARGGGKAVRNAMMWRYAQLGAERGYLGAPITDEYPVSGGWEQRFEGGTLRYVYGQFNR